MYISGDKQTKAKTTAKAATATRAPVSIDMRQLPANENSRSAIYDNQRRRQPRCQQLQQPMQQQQQQRQQLIGNCCRVWRCSARQFVWSTVAPIDKSGGGGLLHRSSISSFCLGRYQTYRTYFPPKNMWVSIAVYPASFRFMSLG